MPLLKTDGCTSQDYWSLPEGRRAELIDGRLYDMAPPSRFHQVIAFGIGRALDEFIEANDGRCNVYLAPFASIFSMTKRCSWNPTSTWSATRASSRTEVARAPLISSRK